MYGGGGIDCRDSENIDVLKDRFTSLSAVSTIWFPLTLDIDEPTLWGHMSLTPGDFSGLSEANPCMVCGKRAIKSGQVLQNRGTQFVLSRPGTVLC